MMNFEKGLEKTVLVDLRRLKISLRKCPKCCLRLMANCIQNHMLWLMVFWEIKAFRGNGRAVLMTDSVGWFVDT